MGTPNLSDEEYLTKKELSYRLKIGERTLDRWMREGQVKRHKFNSKLIRFRWSEVVKHLESMEAKSQRPRAAGNPSH
ncbi:MAG: hypothetical protein WCO56_24890 [Verrucomicrobiota bacterium]